MVEMVKKINVLLLEDYKTLGKKYAVVAVAPIFAKNVLFPNGVARFADPHTIREMQKKIDKHKVEQAHKVEGIKEMVQKVKDAGGLIIERNANDDGKLYEKVNEQDIVDAIQQLYGIELVKSDLKLSKKIERVGEYSVNLIYGEFKELLPIVVPSHDKGEETEKKPVKRTVKKK